MQTDPKTDKFTPSRYTKSISATLGNETVFSMSTDISLSTHPVIVFL